MKKSLWVLALLTTAIMSDVVVASAQAVPSPAANASISFFPQLTVAKGNDLNFGVWTSAANVTYRINADATATTTGATATFIGTAKSAAAFTATGQPNAAVTWTFPAPTATVNVASGTNNFNITLLQPSGVTANALNTTLSAGGTSTVYVGGTFTSPATAPVAGTYTSGTGFTVQVAYQ